MAKIKRKLYGSFLMMRILEHMDKSIKRWKIQLSKKNDIVQN